MGVANLEEIRSFNDYIRKKLLKRVESCPPEMVTWKPAPDKWSVAEHVEHLARAEEIYIHWLSHLVAEGRAKGLTGAPQTVDAVPPLTEAAAGPMEAPPEMEPQGRPLAESLERLAASRAEIDQFYGQLAVLQTDELTIPFRTVRLNAAQVMHLIGLHELRHERHLAGLLEAWGTR
ncbi:MAG: DinB family protein [Bacillota bacterium]